MVTLEKVKLIDRVVRKVEKRKNELNDSREGGREVSFKENI